MSRTSNINNIDAVKKLQAAAANATAGITNAVNGVVGKITGKQGSYSQTPLTPGNTGQFAAGPAVQSTVPTGVEGKTGKPIAECPQGMHPSEDGLSCVYNVPLTAQQAAVFTPSPNPGAPTTDNNANYWVGRKLLGSGCACGR